MTATQTRAPTSSYHLFTGASGASAITVRSLLTRLLMLVLSFFALLIVATLLVAFSPTLSRSLTSFFVKTQSGAVAWNGTDPVNMVVVGLDERPGMAGQFPHTDTMMVVSILPGSGSVRMLYPAGPMGHHSRRGAGSRQRRLRIWRHEEAHPDGGEHREHAHPLLRDHQVHRLSKGD